MHTEVKQRRNEDTGEQSAKASKKERKNVQKKNTVKHGEYLCSWIKIEFMRNEVPSSTNEYIYFIYTLHVPSEEIFFSLLFSCKCYTFYSLLLFLSLFLPCSYAYHFNLQLKSLFIYQTTNWPMLIFFCNE